MAATATHFRTCPLCEATCGLEITMEAGTVAGIRGDKDDVFSRGFICPKGTAVKHLQEDPDRLHHPMVKDTDGTHRQASWDEAYAVMEQALRATLDAQGRNAVALYVGNPTVHSLSAMVMGPALLRSLGTQNYYTAASVDQIPKHVTCGLMFGNPDLIPVPDIDRTSYLLVLGANPWVSNGSLATAPDWPGRLKAIRARGGKVVVVDPRRTETARQADEHLFIRPGTDAFLVLAIANTLFAENRVDLGDLGPHVAGLDALPRHLEPFTAETAEAHTGIPAETVRRLGRDLADAQSASIYDRVGVHQHTFGTVTSWACDVVNILTGNLDRPGGRMFPLPAHGASDPPAPRGRGWRLGAFSSRVKGYPEAHHQLPVATLADEIVTPGDGQVKALITVAGNPVLSTPNGSRLSAALEQLDFMISVDPYLNETTRHADVILPPPPLLTKAHYDIAFYALSVRNVANYSPPIMSSDAPDEWEILARIALAAGGSPVDTDPSVVPALTLQALAAKATAAGGSLAGRNPEELIKAVAHREPIQQILDFRLRAGPYGDRFGQDPDGLTLAKLEAESHGIDLGPLQPRLPNALKTASGKVELAPQPIIDDLRRVAGALQDSPPPMVLIGRRHLRSNNSWMHNVATMVRGSNRCTLLVHPDDAQRLGLADSGTACVRSRAGEVEAVVEICEDIMPGVVSLPHGWGHGRSGTRMTIAGANAGVSANDLTDEQVIDPLSGNAMLNAVPVTVEAAVPAMELAGSTPI